MDKSPFTLADIFRTGFKEYTAVAGRLPYEHYKIANAIMNCHTAALGGHVFHCDQCNNKNISYNSCRNRHCPSCQAKARYDWVDSRMKELLPVPYFHVVFTIPAQLNPIALRNKRIVYSILFKAAAETLHTLAEREKYLGAAIGFIAVLHTWGQNLMDHPHLHCIVPAGGINDDKTRWKMTPRESFLFPVKVVARLFRGKFLALLRHAVAERTITFCGRLQLFTKNKSFGSLIDTMYKTEWIVYAKRPFAGPEAVLKYLGRYTHRIAIANSRITDVTDTTVSFRWKDYADNGRQKVMTLSRSEFIRRFLLHTLPAGFVRVRYFGFLGQAVKKKQLQQCRVLLGEIPAEQKSEAGTTGSKKTIKNHSTEKPRWCCPVCEKGHLTPYRKIPPLYQRSVQKAAVA